MSRTLLGLSIDSGLEGVDAVARYWSANVMVTLADISV